MGTLFFLGQKPQSLAGLGAGHLWPPRFCTLTNLCKVFKVWLEAVNKGLTIYANCLWPLYKYCFPGMERAWWKKAACKCYVNDVVKEWGRDDEDFFFNLKHSCSQCSFSTAAAVEVHQHCATPCCFRFMMYSLHIPLPLPVPCRTVIVLFQFRVFYTAVAWHIVKFCFKNTQYIHCEGRSECFDQKTFRKRTKKKNLCSICALFFPLSLWFEALCLPSQKHKRSTEHCLCNSIAIIQLRPPEGNTIKLAGQQPPANRPSAEAGKYFECFHLVLQMWTTKNMCE